MWIIFFLNTTENNQVMTSRFSKSSLKHASVHTTDVNLWLLLEISDLSSKKYSEFEMLNFY